MIRRFAASRAALWHEGEFYNAAQRDNLEILDRVGGGDGFASGRIYGFLSGEGTAPREWSTVRPTALR